MNSSKIRKGIFLLLAIAWMCTIFSFSGRDATTSTKDSVQVGHLVGHWFIKGFDEWSQQRQDAFAQAVDHPIRKTAHATEYAILGILFWGCIYERGRKYRFVIVLPWILATVYAATDEFHQLFIPGRSGQIKDVLIDSSGALAGVLVITGLAVAAGSIKKRKAL